MKKFSYLKLLFFFYLFLNCNSASNSAEFLKQFSGNYLYTDDELVKVYSKENKLILDWRGAKDIKPMKVDDATFYVKEMNAKIQFLVNPKDKKEYLVFVPKNSNEELQFKHVKVDGGFKTPSQYLANNDFKKAKEAYLKIKEKDSLNPIINRRRFNRLGYRYLRNDSIKKALFIFKLNIALHPYSDNVYDSYAEALLKNKDTVGSIENYKKSLSLDSGNRNAKRQLKKIRKKH